MRTNTDIIISMNSTVPAALLPGQLHRDLVGYKLVIAANEVRFPGLTISGGGKQCLQPEMWLYFVFSVNPCSS